MSAVTTEHTSSEHTESAKHQAAQHGNKAHSDGGWDSNAKGYVPVQTRSARFTSTNPADFPDVIGYEAEWKLSPIALFRPLLDGELDGSTYEFTATGAPGATVEWVDRTDSRVGAAGKPEEKASANAWNSFDKALSITVTSDEHIELNVSRSTLGRSPRAGHTLITAKANSRATVVLDNAGEAFLSENVEIVVEDGAEL